MKAGRLGGFSSQLSSSSAMTRTSKPAARISAASTWSWLRPRQRRQAAMGDEGLQPDDGVVPPIGPARALPPGDSRGVGAHAMAHAELEDAGKGAVRRLADHQGLENAEARVRLHGADQPQD